MEKQEEKRTGSANPEDDEIEGDEIEVFLAKDLEDRKKRLGYLLWAGIAGVGSGITTLIWYQNRSPADMQEVAQAVAINMAAITGVLLLLIGLGFVGTVLYIRRNLEKKQSPPTS